MSIISKQLSEATP